MIFVLEDNPDRIEIFKEQYPDMLYATNSQEGLEIVRNNELDMIFLDFTLGLGTAIPFAEALVLERLHRDVTIIIHTESQSSAKILGSILIGRYVQYIPFLKLMENWP